MPTIKLAKEQEQAIMEQVLADTLFLAKNDVQKKWTEYCSHLKPILDVDFRFLRITFEKLFQK